MGAQDYHRTATISDLLCVPILVLIIPVLSTRTLLQVPAEASSCEAEETLREMAVEFCLQNLSFILVELCDN
jgi:hypothetical protein